MSLNWGWYCDVPVDPWLTEPDKDSVPASDDEPADFDERRWREDSRA